MVDLVTLPNESFQRFETYLKSVGEKQRRKYIKRYMYNDSKSINGHPAMDGQSKFAALQPQIG
jgi:hypothetical protein